jgi:hypothetical protein
MIPSPAGYRITLMPTSSRTPVTKNRAPTGRPWRGPCCPRAEGPGPCVAAGEAGPLRIRTPSPRLPPPDARQRLPTSCRAPSRRSSCHEEARTRPRARGCTKESSEPRSGRPHWTGSRSELILLAESASYQPSFLPQSSHLQCGEATASEVPAPDLCPRSRELSCRPNGVRDAGRVTLGQTVPVPDPGAWSGPYNRYAGPPSLATVEMTGLWRRRCPDASQD